MAKVHDFLEMGQGSQKQRATQQECCAQNMQMTTVGYLSDAEAIVKASWSNFYYDGAAVFQWLEWSAVQPALSVKNIPGEQTQV